MKSSEDQDVQHKAYTIVMKADMNAMKGTFRARVCVYTPCRLINSDFKRDTINKHIP